MRVFDTNILIHATDDDSEHHHPCLRYLRASRHDIEQSYLTWSVCYEFLRVVTHPNVLRSPLTVRGAWGFLEFLLESPSFSILTHTERHAEVLIQTAIELPDVRGSLAHDLHTAVSMREHGVNRICTFDTDFLRFPFLTIVDPVSEPLP